jgi:hypothetical protein
VSNQGLGLLALSPAPGEWGNRLMFNPQRGQTNLILPSAILQFQPHSAFTCSGDWLTLDFLHIPVNEGEAC